MAEAQENTQKIEPLDITPEDDNDPEPLLKGKATQPRGRPPLDPEEKIIRSKASRDKMNAGRRAKTQNKNEAQKRAMIESELERIEAEKQAEDKKFQERLAKHEAEKARKQAEIDEKESYKSRIAELEARLEESKRPVEPPVESTPARRGMRRPTLTQIPQQQSSFIYC